MDDRLEAEAVDAAVALMVPVLKAFMADKPSRQIAEMQKPHAQKLAIAAISGWIAKRAEQGVRRGLTALSVDKLIALRPNVELDDPKIAKASCGERVGQEG